MLKRRGLTLIEVLVVVFIVALLLAILALCFSAGTFDIEQLTNSEFNGAVLPLRVIFVLLFIGFAVKLPIVPLHSWLPDAHTNAPTAVSVMLKSSVPPERSRSACTARSNARCAGSSRDASNPTR